MKPQPSAREKDLIEEAARVIWKSDKRAGVWDSPEVMPAHRANARALAKAGLLASEEMRRDAKLGAMVRGMEPMTGILKLGFGMGIVGSVCKPFRFSKAVVRKGGWTPEIPWSNTPEAALRAAAQGRKSQSLQPRRAKENKRGRG